MTHQLKRMMFSSVELFCLVAQYNSFTEAAQQAGLTPAAVSRSIARLEQRLQTQLFIRSTRKVRLSQEGELYFAECRQALRQILEAEQLLQRQGHHLSGYIRISVPTPYGHYRILPLLPEFLRLYPHIQIDIQLTNTNVDFIAEGFDLAIRGRNLADSNLIARKLEVAELVVVASADYLERTGTPQRPDELEQHQCIQFMLPSTGKNVPWLFYQDGKIQECPTFGKIRCRDDILGSVTLAKSGAGLLQTYKFIVEKDLQEGRLIELLHDYAGASRPFSLLYPSRKHQPLHLKVFIDFLLEHLRQ